METPDQLLVALHALTTATELAARDTKGSESLLRRVARRIRALAASQRDTDLEELAESVLASGAEHLDASVVDLQCAVRRRLHPPMTREGPVVVSIRDPALRSSVVSSLSELSTTVIECDRPETAWGQIEKAPAAALVLDLSPTEAALAVLERVEQDPTLNRLPRIALNTSGTPADTAAALALGAWEVFTPGRHGVRLAPCLATLLDLDIRVGLEFLDSDLGLPGEPVLRKKFRSQTLEAERSGAVHTLVMLRPTGLTEATEKFGREFRNGVLRSCVAHVARLTAATSHADDDETLAFLLPMDDGAATAVLSAVADAVSQEAFPTPDGETWFTRVAVGGVSVRSISFGRARASAKRMLLLARQAGAMVPVVTTLASEAPARQRVLVVEDDPTVSEILSRTLENLGLDVVTREDGVAALQVASEMRFDLILTDVVMPFMDGLTLIEKLRQTPRYRRTPVVVLTSLGTERHVVHGFEAGVDAYITKPFNVQILSARVRSLLDR